MTAGDAPLTSAALLQRIAEAYARYLASIDAFEGDLAAPDAVGDWSVRDVIAHVGADERWMAAQLEALRAGVAPTVEACYGEELGEPGEFDLSTQDGRNAWQHARLRGIPLDEVLEMRELAHERLLAVARACSDADLAQILTIAPLGSQGHIRRPESGEQGWPLWQWLRGVTYGHYDDHAAAIRDATRPA